MGFHSNREAAITHNLAVSRDYISQPRLSKILFLPKLDSSKQFISQILVIHYHEHDSLSYDRLILFTALRLQSFCIILYRSIETQNIKYLCI